MRVFVTELEGGHKLVITRLGDMWIGQCSKETVALMRGRRPQNGQNRPFNFPDRRQHIDKNGLVLLTVSALTLDRNNETIILTQTAGVDGLSVEREIGFLDRVAGFHRRWCRRRSATDHNGSPQGVLAGVGNRVAFAHIIDGWRKGDRKLDIRESLAVDVK